MKQPGIFKQFWISATVLTGLFLMTHSVLALDAAYSRKGPFTGIGFTGGGGILMGDENNGVGDLGLNLQLGLGASENMTVALNVDNRLQMGDHVVHGMIVPGPEFTIFVSKSAYLNAGVGIAVGLRMGPENDSAIGMNAGLSIGYEHFVNTNIAAYLGGGVDYYLLNDADDILTFTFSLGIRYY